MRALQTLGLLILGACGQVYEPSEVTVRRVPAIEYRLQHNDCISWLVNSEMDESTRGRYTANSLGDLYVIGDEGNKYEFHMGRVNAQANPDTRMRQRETIIVPDLNEDGCVMNQCGPVVGEFIFTASRSIEDPNNYTFNVDETIARYVPK